MEFACHSELYAHRRLYHGKNINNLQKEPWEVAPWEDESSVDQPLADIYQLHKDIILQKHTKNKLSSTFNFPITNNITTETILEHIQQIFQQQDNAFKINFGFGMILKNIENGSYRYFSAASNVLVFDHPVSISSEGKCCLFFNISPLKVTIYVSTLSATINYTCIERGQYVFNSMC